MKKRTKIFNTWIDEFKEIEKLLSIYKSTRQVDLSNKEENINKISTPCKVLEYV